MILHGTFSSKMLRCRISSWTFKGCLRRTLWDCSHRVLLSIRKIIDVYELWSVCDITVCFSYEPQLLHYCLLVCAMRCVNVSSSLSDVNECALGEVDCSPWADCVDMFGSYTCVCHHGYVDANPERPGRTCQGTVAVTTPGFWLSI